MKKASYLLKIFLTIHGHACLNFMQMKPRPQNDLQGKVTDIIVPMRWASTSSDELCCQGTALNLMEFRRRGNIYLCPDFIMSFYHGIWTIGKIYEWPI